jgi:hypothetical protein
VGERVVVATHSEASGRGARAASHRIFYHLISAGRYIYVGWPETRHRSAFLKRERAAWERVSGGGGAPKPQSRNGVWNFRFALCVCARRVYQISVNLCVCHTTGHSAVHGFIFLISNGPLRHSGRAALHCAWIRIAFSVCAGADIGRRS